MLRLNRDLVRAETVFNFGESVEHRKERNLKVMFPYTHFIVLVLNCECYMRMAHLILLTFGVSKP